MGKGLAQKAIRRYAEEYKAILLHNALLVLCCNYILLNHVIEILNFILHGDNAELGNSKKLGARKELS